MSLAQLYHAHHSLHMEDMPFWMSLAEEQGGLILELGCGTGRVLIPLCQAGYSVYGLDNDSEMLEVLHANLPPELRDKANISQADLTDFQLDIRFPLALLPCNTYSTLSVEERVATLRAVRDRLKPGGVFSFSVPNPEELANLPAQGVVEVEDVFLHPVTQNPVQATSNWARIEGKVAFIWHYDHLLPDGNVERLTLRNLHTLTTAETYQEELEFAGFAIQGVYGDFDRAPFTLHSPYMIVVAVRE